MSLLNTRINQLRGSVEDISWSIGNRYGLLNELKELIAKEIIMKKYIAPHDMFQGGVKKGEIYAVYTNQEYMYSFPLSIDNYGVPTEIVKTWEEYAEPEPFRRVWASRFGDHWFPCYYNNGNNLVNRNKVIIYHSASEYQIREWDDCPYPEEL